MRGRNVVYKLLATRGPVGEFKYSYIRVQCDENFLELHGTPLNARIDRHCILRSESYILESDCIPEPLPQYYRILQRLVGAVLGASTRAHSPVFDCGVLRVQFAEMLLT